MTDKKEDNQGCISIKVTLGILIIGLILRVLLGGGKRLMTDLWVGFLSLLFLFGFVWILNNYKKG